MSPAQVTMSPRPVSHISSLFCVIAATKSLGRKGKSANITGSRTELNYRLREQTLHAAALILGTGLVPYIEEQLPAAARSVSDTAQLRHSEVS